MPDLWICPNCDATTDEPAFSLSPFDLSVYCPTCPGGVELEVNPDAFPAEPRAESTEVGR